MKIREYIAMTREAERSLAEGFRHLARRHSQNSEIYSGALRFAGWSEDLTRRLEMYVAKYGRAWIHPPERVSRAVFKGLPLGGFGLLRDLQDASLLASRAKTLWLALSLAAQELKDPEFEALGTRAEEEIQRGILWLQTQIRVTAPQALTVRAMKSAEIRASIPVWLTPAIYRLLWGGLVLVSGAVILAGIASIQKMLSPDRPGLSARVKGVPRRAPLPPRA